MNPFKPGDKVEYAASSHPSVHAVIATYGDNWLWLDDADDVPYTARTEGYVKAAEEPIVPGQRWKRVGDSYQALVEGVTDKHVVYSVSHNGYKLFARTHASFREEYHR